MNCIKRLSLLLAVMFALNLWANEWPTVSPTVVYTTAEGEVIEDATTTQNAPLKALFRANPKDAGGYTARYEWKVIKNGDKEHPLVHRFEEDMEYTFVESGSFQVQLEVLFVHEQDTIAYPDESGEPQPFQVSISESKLEFPNAFSPNGDGYNDVLKAKSGYQSIVEFQAAVFSRSGRKLYSWNTLDGGWDGKQGSGYVSDGIYYLVVSAKGADGIKYNIRKTITVLTGYNNEKEGDNGGE